MKNKRYSYFLLLGIIFLIIFFVWSLSLFFYYNYADNSNKKINENQNEKPDNYVVRIIDGDTFKLENGKIVRMLCIDAPELGKTGAEEAKDFLENLILNKEVQLEKDINDVDKYNRSLRYVWINDSSNIKIFVNKEMINKGFASEWKVEPDITKC